MNTLVNEKDKKNFIITVFGNKGYGKSYLIKKFFIPKMKNVIIFDTLDEYDSKKILKIDNVETLVNFLYKCNRNNVKYKIRLCYTNFDDYELTFKVLRYFQKFTLILDEIYQFANSRYIDSNLNDFFNLGRHSGINIVAMSRRPFQINRMVTSQSDLIICFKLKETRDLKYISDFATETIAEQTQALDYYEFTAYGDKRLIDKFEIEPKYFEQF